MNQLAVSWQDKAQFSDSTGTFPNFVTRVTHVLQREKRCINVLVSE